MKRIILEFRLNKLDKQIKRQQQNGNTFKAYELSLKRFDLSHKLLNNY